MRDIEPIVVWQERVFRHAYRCESFGMLSCQGPEVPVLCRAAHREQFRRCAALRAAKARFGLYAVQYRLTARHLSALMLDARGMLHPRAPSFAEAENRARGVGLVTNTGCPIRRIGTSGDSEVLFTALKRS